MSKWLIITIAMVVFIVSITTALLVVFLKRRTVNEAVEDEAYLKQKQDVLQHAINAKLNDNKNLVQVTASKLLSQTNDAATGVKKANTSLEKSLVDQQKTIENLKKMYAVEMKKIRDTDKEMEAVVRANSALKQDMEMENISKILDTTTPTEIVHMLEKRFK